MRKPDRSRRGAARPKGLSVAGQPGGAVIRETQVTGDAIAVSGIHIAGDYLNVSQAVVALGGQVALAPPKLGDWGLVGRKEDLKRLDVHLGQHGQASVTSVSGLGSLGKTALPLGYRSGRR